MTYKISLETNEEPVDLNSKPMGSWSQKFWGRQFSDMYHHVFSFQGFPWIFQRLRPFSWFCHLCWFGTNVDEGLLAWPRFGHISSQVSMSHRKDPHQRSFRDGKIIWHENNIPHIYIDLFCSEKMGAKFISINPSHLNPQLSFPSVAIPSPSPPRPTTHEAHLVFKAQRNSGASEPWVSDGGSSGSGTRIVAI